MLEKYLKCLTALSLLDRNSMKLPDNILEKIISEIRFDFSGDKFAPKGESKIPRVFYLGKDVIEKINNYGLKTSGQRHIKLLSKGKKIYMYVSPLFFTAIKGVERGRSSYEKEGRKPELTKLITDLIPGVVRGKMKKLVSPKVDTMLKMHSINFPFIVSNKNQTGYWVPAFASDDKDIDTISTGLYENKMKKSELKSIIREVYSEFQRSAKGSKEVMAKKIRKKIIIESVEDVMMTFKDQPLLGGYILNILPSHETLTIEIASEPDQQSGKLSRDFDKFQITYFYTDKEWDLSDANTSPSPKDDGLLKKIGSLVSAEKQKESEYKSKQKQKLGGLQEDSIDEVMVAGEFVKPEIVTAIMAIVPTLIAIGAAINWKEELLAWTKQMKAKYAK
jgi:ribosomal protein S20